jgi:hypothetical protein
VIIAEFASGVNCVTAGVREPRKFVILSICVNLWPLAWPAACQLVELAERSAGMMRRGAVEFDERFTAFVRSRGEHHLRVATLLTGNPAHLRPPSS